MSFPSQAEERALHERVLKGDPVASADVFRTFMDPILGVLIGKEGRPKEEAYDSAIDALVSYLRSPGRYLPHKGRLSSYLTQAAKKRAMDRHRSNEARDRREQEFGGVFELQARTPKETLEMTVEARLAIGRLELFKLRDEDRAFLELVLQGEGSTRRLAKVLKLPPLPESDLRREVKRHRDRLMKWLARLGKEDANVES